jgi:hypothetical protein
MSSLLSLMFSLQQIGEQEGRPSCARKGGAYVGGVWGRGGLNNVYTYE